MHYRVKLNLGLWDSREGMKSDIIIQWVRYGHICTSPTYSKLNRQGSSELHVQIQ